MLYMRQEKNIHRLMDPRHLFRDDRLTDACAYCEGPPETRDHVPSRVLLDEPFPPELPVVGACSKCNRSFSLDEQYLACFIECVVCGSSDPERLTRPKIKRILSKNPSLQARIAASQGRDLSGNPVWAPEVDRIHNVLIKLARGHIAYETAPTFEDPDQVVAIPLPCMSPPLSEEFEKGTPEERVFFSEIGTRSFLREVGSKPDSFEQNGGWIVVQPDRYRYAVTERGETMVRMVLSEYLAGIVIWES